MKLSGFPNYSRILFMSGLCPSLSLFLPIPWKHGRNKSSEWGPQHFHLLPVLSAGSLPSHKLHPHEHHVRWWDGQDLGGFPCLWHQAAAHHSPVNQGSLAWHSHSLKERRGSKTFCFSDLSTYTFFIRKTSTKGRNFAENIFCLLWFQPHYLSGFSIIQSVASQKLLMSTR